MKPLIPTSYGLNSSNNVLLQGFGIKQPTNVYIYLPTPPLGQDMTQGQFLSGVYRFEFRVFLFLD